jgi:UDP-glucose 4-epimerase
VLIASSEKIKQELGWSPKFQDLKLIIQSPGFEVASPIVGANHIRLS